MQPYRVVMVVGAMLASLVPFLAQAVQDGEVLPVTPGAGRYLPTPEDLGDDWVSTLQAGIAPGPELFTEGARESTVAPVGLAPSSTSG